MVAKYQLHPFPRFWLIPLDNPPESDVLVFDISETLHAYHQVADEGGKIWIRLGDEVREADQWLIRALTGQRGLNRPVPELAVQDRPQYDRSAGRVTQMFVLSNHGIGSLREVQVGVIVSTSEVGGPLLDPTTRIGSRVPPRATPVPLEPFYQTSNAITSIWSHDQVRPFQDVSFVAGCDGLMIELVHFGIWVTAEGISPIIRAYEMGWESDKRIFRAMEGPPYHWPTGSL
ncbi:hypothetical protein MYX82_04835 [Acidobacteria bacterium AH-259-D05]|nr:hypothetical protein [Acidobacteria bacterium AH-259-D05]